MALLSPMSPPKDYSFAERNFDQEYQSMKADYERKQQQQQQQSFRPNGESKFDFSPTGSKS
jgi:hypothetical protein